MAEQDEFYEMERDRLKRIERNQAMMKAFEVRCLCVPLRISLLKWALWVVLQSNHVVAHWPSGCSSCMPSCCSWEPTCGGIQQLIMQLTALLVPYVRYVQVPQAAQQLACDLSEEAAAQQAAKQAVKQALLKPTAAVQSSRPTRRAAKAAAQKLVTAASPGGCRMQLGCSVLRWPVPDIACCTHLNKLLDPTSAAG
jgi:hypothetical protein